MSASAVSAGPDRADRLRNAAAALAVAVIPLTVLVILMGAMTTSTDSGMAFVDWPLSDGELMPERAFTEPGPFLEHFHRVLAGLAGLMCLLVAIFVTASSSVPRPTVVAAWTGLVLISVQGVIGGLGVLNNLPIVTSATHGTLAQVTIATLGITAYMLSRGYAKTVPVHHAKAGAARTFTVVMLVLLIVQTVIGAIARHTRGGGEHALWTHVGNAFVVFLVVIITLGITARLESVPGVRRLGRWGLGLLMVQITLGFTALLVREGKQPENIEYLWRAALISSHVLIGALLTLTAALLVAHVRRGTLVEGSRG